METFEANTEQTVLFENIDHKLVKQFKYWLLNTMGYSLNHAGLQIRLLKMICREAERMGVEVNTYTRHIESFTQKSSDRYLQTLSLEEIQQIKVLEDLSPTLENSRKWLLIGLTIGQRVSDLLTLEQNQIRQAGQGLYIDIIQQKTEKYVTVGVIDPMVIYILTKDFPYKISPQQFNVQLKEICKRAGIDNLEKPINLVKKQDEKYWGYIQNIALSHHTI